MLYLFLVLPGMVSGPRAQSCPPTPVVTLATKEKGEERNPLPRGHAFICDSGALVQPRELFLGLANQGGRGPRLRPHLCGPSGQEEIN